MTRPDELKAAIERVAEQLDQADVYEFPPSYRDPKAFESDISALIDAARRVEAWRDINQAPKTGERILAAFPWTDSDGKEVVCVGTVVWRERWYPDCPPSWLFEAVNDTYMVSPTHWQPMPPAPEPKGLT